MSWRLPKIQISVYHLHGPEKPEVRLPPPPKSLRDIERDAWVLDAHTQAKAWRFAAFGLAGGVLTGAALALAVATWATTRLQTQGLGGALLATLGAGHVAAAKSTGPAPSRAAAALPAVQSPQHPAAQPSAPAVSAQSAPTVAGAVVRNPADVATFVAAVPMPAPMPATPIPGVPVPAARVEAPSVVSLSPSVRSGHASPAAMPTKPDPAVVPSRPARPEAGRDPILVKVVPHRAEAAKTAPANKEAPKKEISATNDVNPNFPPIVYQAPAQIAPNQAATTKASPASEPGPPAKGDFKLIGVPTPGVALIEVAPNQIVPFRPGDTLPNGRILKSADPKSGMITY